MTTSLLQVLLVEDDLGDAARTVAFRYRLPLSLRAAVSQPQG
jgi:hypothetical protein